MEKRNWHTLSAEEVFGRLETGYQGLKTSTANTRLSEQGPNQLIAGEKKTLLSIFLAQFGDMMIWVLIGAAVISGLVGEWIDASIILIVVFLNAILGTVQESKAEAALDALKKMAAPTAQVIRDGVTQELAASELVTGDIVLLEAGDSIPADLRLVEAVALKVEESALTGESVPVEKTTLPLDEENVPLGDQTNMAFMGTAVTYGRGTGVVVATGMETQMGAIANQLSSSGNEPTPLQQKLNQISHILSIGVLIIAAVVFTIGLAMGNPPLTMFLTAVSLAVAAIPEGLVAVVTIVLALGMSRMASRGAIIRRLPAVETLGSTQVICSDKTGTLTQNKMTVQELWTENRQLLMDAMGHCNDSKLGEGIETIGDPTETALIDFVLQNQSWTAKQIRERKRLGEVPFDSQRKLSTVAIEHPNGKGMRIFVKGAPDVLIARCIKEERFHDSSVQVQTLDSARVAQIEKANEEMAKQGLRVLAFAYKDETRADFSNAQEVESNLTFIGLVGMIDPARPEAKRAIAQCRQAGILPVMITGDHKITAMAIAQEIGILTPGMKAVTGQELEAMTDKELEENVAHIGVYARVAPEHKSRIVSAWQRRGMTVAMTGDGVNDAPALKIADIGVGMGITGTDVSKQASDMVLTDDNFATIVSAVKEGRRIFDNIHKTVRFLLSSNAGEVIAILTATLWGWRLLSPVHILWINLVTDTFPAIALGMEPAELDVMERKPRDKKIPFLQKRDWFSILTVGAVEAGLALLAYVLGGKGVTGTTMAFLTLSLSQLFAAVGFQSERHSIFRIKFKEHPVLWLAFLGSALLQLVVMFVPQLRNVFDLTPLTGVQWLTVGALCVGMLAFVELQKLIVRLRATN
ncbi:MAG: cation-translocating P-type ATPase [Firmicutes bacterium]|nr:cation-translocating P-type ATPase [Bacillota bacterium]